MRLVYSSFWWLPYIGKKLIVFFQHHSYVFLVEHEWFCSTTKEKISGTSSGWPDPTWQHHWEVGNSWGFCWDKLFYKYDTVALFFPPRSAWWKDFSFHWGENWVCEWNDFLFLKKRKKSETSYLICRAESLIPLTKSVRCALPWTRGERLTSLDCSWRWKDPNLQDPPPPREIVSPVLTEVRFGSLSSPGGWQGMCVMVPIECGDISEPWKPSGRGYRFRGWPWSKYCLSLIF